MLQHVLCTIGISLHVDCIMLALRQFVATYTVSGVCYYSFLNHVAINFGGELNLVDGLAYRQVKSANIKIILDCAHVRVWSLDSSSALLGDCPHAKAKVDNISIYTVGNW